MFYFLNGQIRGQSCICNKVGYSDYFVLIKCTGENQYLIVVNVNCSALIRLVVHTELNF